jgi:cell division protein FtsW (lipid II flippase)
MNERPRPVVGHIIEFIGVSEYRRLLVVVGIPVISAVLLWQRNSLGTAAVLLAVVLAVFLYTRSTARQTIAASTYATGVLLITLFLLALYWTWSQGSTEPLGDVVSRYRWRAVTGALLIGLGLWLRQIEV